MISLNEQILNQDDPFEFVYEGISGTHGPALMEYLTEMYSQVTIDYYLHPDDDFEKIIDRMIQIMEDDR
jgi:hypothetical protein